MVEASTVERLTRLRALLASALAAATDQTAAGRHVAVISLDGVCEMALHLAADALDIDIQLKHGFEDVHGMVAGKLGTRWNRRSSKGVRELHRARNNVQHHGILPDATHVPLWTSESDRFIHSLVRAAFDCDLSSITAADAVEDEDLRAGLIEAERSLAAGEFGAAIVAAKHGVDEAIRRFRSLRGLTGSTRLGYGMTQYQEFRAIDEALEGLERYVEVAYLATDPAEWLWLRRMAEQHSSLAEPTREDAQRAFGFAMSWILRYEAFASRQPEAVYRESIEPELDAVYQAPRLVAASFEALSFPLAGVEVHLTLADVPPTWTDSLYDGSSATNEESGARISAGTDRNGDAIQVHLPAVTDPTTIRPTVDRLLAATHAAFEARIESRRETRRQEYEIAARYRDELVGDERITVTEVLAELRHGSNYVRARVELEDAPPRSLIETALNREGSSRHRVHVSFTDGWLFFDEQIWSPEAVIPAFEAALAEARELSRVREEEAEAARTQREKLLEGARDAFSDLA